MFKQISFLASALCALSWPLSGAVPPEWAFSQDVMIAKEGNTRLKLPLETISRSRPDLGDLRLIDSAGQELAFFIDQPVQESAAQFPLGALSIRMEKGKTVVSGMVPAQLLERGYDALILQTATDDFLKPVSLEGSRDGKKWVGIIRNYPIFKQPGQMVSTSAPFPKTSWPYLRLTLDDSATPAIRVQGLSVFSAARPIQNLEPIAVTLTDQSSDSRQSVIQALLPTAHLRMNALRIRTPESTYRRRVQVFARTFVNGEFQEVSIGEGYIHRVQLDSQVSERVSVPLYQPVPGRQIVVRIDNGDTRPLIIESITAEVIPAYLVFDAPAAGSYALWSGNPGATAKLYDVEALRASFAQAHVVEARAGVMADNPDFKRSEPLPQVDELGTEIDVSQWPHRKKVSLTASGVQRLELDIEALAHNQGHLASLRLVREGKQIPYVYDFRQVWRELIYSLVQE